MNNIIGLVILVIDIVVVIDILKTNKDTTKKVLWILAVIFLPILGPLLWWFMGRK